MPDLDELMTSSVSSAAADAARVPAVGALAVRGARRRRVRRGGMLVGAASAVAAITLGLGQLGPGPATSPTPAPQPSTASTAPTTTASQQAHDLAASEQILAASGSRVWSLTVAPGSPQHRLSEWYSCLDPGTCQSRRYALAVTSDGFASRHVLDVPGNVEYPYDVEPAGSNHFIVSRNARLVGVVDLSGQLRRITVAGAAGPAADGEVVSTAGTRRPVAIDPASGRAHPLALPPGTSLLVNESGRLWASGRTRFAWSDDGGRHWNPVTPTGLGRRVALPIPSAAPGIVGLLVGGQQVNTTLPWLDTLRSVDGSPLSSNPPPTATVNPNAVAILPNGRLLVLVTTWGAWQGGRQTPRAGFYVGQDWSHLVPVRMGAPFATLSYSDVPTVLSVTASTGTVTIYAEAPSQDGVVTSVDGGATWHAEAAR